MKRLIMLAMVIGLFMSIPAFADTCISEEVIMAELILPLGYELVPVADNCTNWMWQTNGCYWRTCTDSKGRQYCQLQCGNNISRVKCN